MTVYCLYVQFIVYNDSLLFIRTVYFFYTYSLLFIGTVYCLYVQFIVYNDILLFIRTVYCS